LKNPLPTLPFDFPQGGEVLEPRLCGEYFFMGNPEEQKGGLPLNVFLSLNNYDIHSHPMTGSEVCDATIFVDLSEREL
jgi:hypothetical protein